MHEYLQKLSLEIVSPDAEFQLKHFHYQDAEELFQLIDRNRNHLSQFGERISQKYPTSVSVQNALILMPSTLFWFGIRNQQNALMGSVSLINHWKYNKDGEIGYWLGREFTGQGYMTNAVKLLTRFAFTNLGIVKITAEAHHSNSPSIKVLAQSGFEFVSLAQARNYFQFEKLPG